MQKVTYLLGAGASFPEFPLAIDKKDNDGRVLLEGLPTKLENCADQILPLVPQFNSDNGKEEFIKDTAQSFKQLAKASREFNTVDTLAKYYYLKDSKQFIKLKETLSLFFLFEQLYFKKFNKKYLVFLTTLMQSLSFPKNIKILTWNYDYQIGIAAAKFKDEDFTASGRGHVINRPLFDYFPTIGSWKQIKDRNDYTLVHLNGIAGFYDQQYTENPYGSHIYKNYKEDQIIDLIRRILPSSLSYLNLAWEKTAESNEGTEIAKEIISGTEILVVIGYSFPFFNRTVDKQIFEVLKNNHSLKIYYQNPSLDGSFLKKQFNLPTTISIEHIKEVNQFYVPFEL